MNNVSGSFFVEMLVDGDSAQGNIRSTKPLAQMYNPGTNKCIPDWTVASNQPVIYPVIRSGNENTIKAVVSGSEKWYYNNVEVTFSSAGLSNYPDPVVGKLQKTTYNNGSVNVPALKIVGNLASNANMDADSIRMDGQIEASGHNLSFSSEISLAISEYSDSAYNGFVYATNGGIIDEESETVTLTTELYKGGDVVASENYSVQWRKLPATTNYSTSKTLTLGVADIDSKNLFICEFIIGGEIVANFIQEVSDETDPYFIDVAWSGKTKIASTDGTLKGTIKVKKVGSGLEESGFTFDVKMTGTNGSAFTPATAPAGGVITLTYADVQKAGGNITGYITATKS